MLLIGDDGDTLSRDAKITVGAGKFPEFRGNLGAAWHVPIGEYALARTLRRNRALPARPRGKNKDRTHMKTDDVPRLGPIQLVIALIVMLLFALARAQWPQLEL